MASGDPGEQHAEVTAGLPRQFVQRMRNRSARRQQESARRALAALPWMQFSSLREYQAWKRRNAAERSVESGLQSAALEAWHSAGSPDGYLLPGLCPVCQLPSTFEIDRTCGGTFQQGVGYVPNWRERQVCSRCHLNARVRASVALIRKLVPNRSASIWVSEQLTPLYATLHGEYVNLVGSEYLGSDIPSGTVDDRGLRHEDSCRSSFKSGSLEAVASFDVLEHVPDYLAAIRDSRRVLKPGGVSIWTAPFLADQYETVIRAKVNDDGSTTHLLPPDYHGDPVNPDAGILCYQYFGWDVLDEMRSAGFSQAHVYQTWSSMHGLLGPPILIFVGRA